MEAETRLSDLPEAILTNIFSLLTDTRTRNSVSLVCRRWLAFDRATRTHLSLRGNVRNLYLIPTSFRSVTHLDLSHISPWGYPLLHSSSDPSLLALRLAHAFPSLLSLALYARTPTTLALLAPHFPNLRHVKLVRWHQRTQTPLGSDFSALFQNCPSLASLDLSHFYYWTEDLPPALQANPLAASSLSRLNLLSLSSPEGFKSHEILAIAATCRNLRHLLAACVFDPRLVDFVGDETVVQLASSCPKLELLHLADASALDGARPDPDDDGYAQEDARITGAALEEVFDRLPLLEELALDVGHNIRASGSALEKLNYKCPKLRSLTLGWFHGVCEAVAPRLDGIALCRGLESLSVKCCADLNDFSLIAIAQGCPRLSKFEIQGCKMVTETGLRKFAGILKRVLVEVRISSCKNLGAAAVLCGLGPVRDRIRRLHIDCCWDGPDQPDSPGSNTFLNFDLNESEPSSSPELIDFLGPTEKKCRYSDESGECSMNNYKSIRRRQLSASVWKRLKYLSIWIPVGELLTPLPSAGLDCCPELEEIRIKVEGDCRSRPKPAQWAFGLTALARYPRLAKMQLDCGEVIGYALTAPPGHMDLSLWERFYLNGIGDMKLRELDYWPPQDRDVNQRSLSLPAAGSLAQCATLRKLFIHGTTHEHFMRFFFQIPNLRDMQLREDYYPAPENDTSTEMRVDSCGRFEDALNSRYIRD